VGKRVGVREGGKEKASALGGSRIRNVSGGETALAPDKGFEARMHTKNSVPCHIQPVLREDSEIRILSAKRSYGKMESRTRRERTRESYSGLSSGPAH